MIMPLGSFQTIRDVGVIAEGSPPSSSAEVAGEPAPEKMSGLFRIALGALASIAADEDTNAEAKTYAADVTRSLTEAAKKLSAVKEAGNGA